MSDATTARAPRPAQTLRRLFLTLFLRGRGARGLKQDEAPKSVGRKLAFTLAFYFLFGCFAFYFVGFPVFLLSVYLQSMTFVFLGMFVASSAGEMLFNSEEADILLHRPVTPRALLWAKVWVLVEVSLWLAVAFNFMGFFVGARAADGGWMFLPVHAASTIMLALFTTGCVVLVYQLCLRWFGRERLEGLMVSAQIVVAVGAMLSGQILPRLVMRPGGGLAVDEATWWICLLPPAWFAGFDDALAGSSTRGSWQLGVLATLSTGLVLWLSFGKLAGAYEIGLQTLNERVAKGGRKGGSGRWLGALVDRPPLRWWLGDPVVRASFLLSAAYLFRDRETKLRVYPGLAPFLVLPLIFAFGNDRHADSTGSSFTIAFVSGYMGLIPLLGVSLLRYSQQWQAADIFRAAPIAGPAPLCRGARQAVMCCLTVPLMLGVAALMWATQPNSSNLLLLLPGVIAMPVFALVPSLDGKGVPLSQPGEEAKSANRGLAMIGVTIISMALSFLVAAAWSLGFFWWLILAEVVAAAALYSMLRYRAAQARWDSME
ncbi:MAG: hypothetical protein AB7G28_26945 [Pirellulales bacterium]